LCAYDAHVSAQIESLPPEIKAAKRIQSPRLIGKS
jgi:hypothetical protein